jgi:5-(carboxyamino)imidazole ribonucleotide synthase
MDTKNWQGKEFKFGLIGGGQLGRMLIQKAADYDLHVHTIDNDPDAPCSKISSSFVVGQLNNYNDILNFGFDKDVLTIEIENVNVDALEALEKLGKIVVPSSSVLRIIQDKGLQKQFYLANDIPTAPFVFADNKEDLLTKITSFPVVNKLRKGGYDGKGVQILRSESDFSKAFENASILETVIDFEKEISVIVARNANGETAVYPTVECYFNEDSNLVELLFSPANISAKLEKESKDLALKVITSFEMTGILAVELFVTKDGKLLVNEVAPRPHNSGHHTIECNHTSQFEQHFRTVLNLPLGSTKMISQGAMVNILGAKGYEGPVYYENIDKVLAQQDVFCHIYGKEITKPNRKMGHITVRANSTKEAIILAESMNKVLKVKSM